ncbi:hypothetical protein, partial [Peribacillus butanolivorans]
MSRAVTADHVLFDECILFFRPKEIRIQDEEQLYGYLLLDFSLTEVLQFEHFTIEPSNQVSLPGVYGAFISRVKLPKWFEWGHNSHLFTIGLASVISFVTGRPVKAPRDGYTLRKNLDHKTLSELAIQFPILTAGPGAHDTQLSNEGTSRLINNLTEMINLIYSMPHDLYKSIMQSIRLVQLAHLNKREDFGLSYYLLVSSIEPVATKAIKRKKVVKENPIKKEWKELAKTNEEFSSLLIKYQDELSKNKYLGIRFVEFIMQYCPPVEWFELEHPYENRNKFMSDFSGDNQDWDTEKKEDERYPDDLSDIEIKNILSDVYKHRSNYTHEGKNPPHRYPNNWSRFFENERIIEAVNGDFYFCVIMLTNL